MSRRIRRSIVLLHFLRLLILASNGGSARVACAENWPQFRGPTGQGQSSEQGLPTTWGGKNDENILWKTPLPHVKPDAKPDLNQSSPIVWDERIFVTTCCWPDKNSQKDFPEQHLTCYSIAEGKQLWDVLVAPGPWRLSDLRGGYGAPTPTTDGERVYVAFGSAMIAAFKVADGQLVWKHDLDKYEHFDVAFATSPIIYQDTILLLCDRNNKASSLLSLDCRTGEVKWEKERPTVAFDHTTPILFSVQGKSQLLIGASNALQAADPTTGEILWSCRAKGDVPTPVYDGKLIYIDSGRGGPGYAVDPTGTGDVSATHVRWKVAQIPEGLSSPVIAGEWLYRLHNPGVVRCLNMTTGEEAFTQRLEGVSTHASPFTTADGLVYIASAGKSYVLKSGPKYELIATNDLNDGTSASPAVAQGKIIFKGAKYLYGVGKK